MSVQAQDQADLELKARHRAMWALGDYPAVAAQLIPELGHALVAACGVTRGTVCSTSQPARATLRSPRR